MCLRRLLITLLLLPAVLTAANLSEEQRLSEQIAGPALTGEAQWLGLQGDARFLALLKISDAEQRYGGAILLHDAGGHADDDLIGPLRLELAKRGWDSLSLQLPRPVDPLDPAQRSMAADQAVERLRAAVAFLTARGTGDLVLIGHGLGAEMALAFLAKDPAPKVHALAAVGLAAGSGGDDDPVLRTIAGLKRPMLDLYGDRDLPEVIATAAARRSAAKRSGRESYRQDRVMGADHGFSGLQESLLQRVASWLRRTALDGWARSR